MWHAGHGIMCQDLHIPSRWALPSAEIERRLASHVKCEDECTSCVATSASSSFVETRSRPTARSTMAVAHEERAAHAGQFQDSDGSKSLISESACRSITDFLPDIEQEALCRHFHPFG